MPRRSRPCYIHLGDNWVIDDITGRKVLASECMYLDGDQEGLVTHRDNWNEEHPQLYIKTRADRQNVKIVRDDSGNTFADPPSQDDL